MCLALPAEVIAVDAEEETAMVSLGDVKKTISTALLETVEPGQFVLVHVGYALNLVSKEEADATLRTMREAGLMDAADEGDLAEAQP